MRLIDADYFKTQITAAATEINMASAGMAFCKIIDAQPTACDMKKVLEELKFLKRYNMELVSEYDEQGKQHFMELAEAKVDAYKKAIEIIKAGGAGEQTGNNRISK